MSKLRDKVIAKYRKAVDKARDALGSTITIYYSLEKDDSTVTWDPIYDEPLNPDDAPTSNPRLETLQSKTVEQVSTSWVGVSNSFIPVSLTAGQLDRNDVYISCKLTDVLLDPSDTSSKTYFDYAIYIDINGTKVKPKTTPLKYGLAGDLYSCALIATKDTNA